MTKKVKQVISAIVSFTLMLTVLATPLGESIFFLKDYSSIKAGAMSTSEVESKIEAMSRGEYGAEYKVGNYWNTKVTSSCTKGSNYEHANNNYDKKYPLYLVNESGTSIFSDGGAIQCKGFAYAVFDQLFGGGDKNAIVATKTTYKGTNKKKYIIENAVVGDILVIIENGGSYGHTGIFYGYNDNYLIMYDANGYTNAGTCKISISDKRPWSNSKLSDSATLIIMHAVTNGANTDTPAQNYSDYYRLTAPDGYQVIRASDSTSSSEVGRINVTSNTYVCVTKYNSDKSWGYVTYNGISGWIRLYYVEKHSTHSYTSSVTTSATCTSAGVRTYKCSCGASYTESIAALGHSYGSWTTATSATCTSGGTEKRTCSRCGNSETRSTSALGHSYSTKVISPTCTVQGYTLHTCLRCGDSYKDTYTNATGHSYSSWTTTKEATCTEDGEQTRTCSSCGAIETETVKALGHNYATTVVKPTCLAEGYTLHECSVCGNSYKDNYTDKLVLSAVTGLTIDTTSMSSLTLSWNKNDNATGYLIQQYKDGEWKHIRQLARNTATTYTATGLAPSTTYQYRVRAYYTDGSTTTYSDYTTISGTTNPTNISGVKVSSTANSVTISWDKNNSATGYFVQQYKNGAWTHVRQLARNTATTFTASGLTTSTTYQYRVRAYYTDGSTTTYSDYTTISGTTNPTNISGVKAASTANSVTISWDKNDSATGYFVQQYKNGAWTHVRQLARNTATTFTASGLTPSTKYQYRIRAYYTDGTSTTYSDYKYVSPTTRPSNITGVKVTSTANTVTLSWDKNNSATGYFVQQYKNGAWTHVRQLARNTATTYTATGLTPSTTYQFRIRAYYTDGTTTTYSDYTQTLTAKTKA